ncbi:MAG: cytochrome c3 family protein [Syntrophaceae bacterium]|nr:cytochrome c3 family protein [Syntrophaceae bacterium]
MKKGLGVILLLIAVMAAFCPGGWNRERSWAAEQEFLADRHKAKEIPCEGCHKETPPKAVEMKTCLGCHGEYKALAAKTQHVEPNPHASHEGELACGACHHGHKPGEDYCAKCHSFGFKVR